MGQLFVSQLFVNNFFMSLIAAEPRLTVPPDPS
jgi:hypothetical protein